MKWKTKDGQILNHYEMETGHIENCLRLLKKRLSEKPDYMVYMGNGDMAELAVESENNHNDRIADELKHMIDVFEGELGYRRMGKPVGEKFPQPAIQSWELNR